MLDPEDQETLDILEAAFYEAVRNFTHKLMKRLRW